MKDVKSVQIFDEDRQRLKVMASAKRLTVPEVLKEMVGDAYGKFQAELSKMT